jgi:hypothetical protein
MNLVQATLMVTEDEAADLVHILEYADENVSDLTYIKDAIRKGYL